MLFMPTMVLRMMGSSEYSTSAVILGMTPSPTSGMSRPNSANEGTVNTALEMDVARLDAMSLR